MKVLFASLLLLLVVVLVAIRRRAGGRGDAPSGPRLVPDSEVPAVTQRVSELIQPLPHDHVILGSRDRSTR